MRSGDGGHSTLTPFRKVRLRNFGQWTYLSRFDKKAASISFPY
jgi:hypothetical protein